MPPGQVHGASHIFKSEQPGFYLVAMKNLVAQMLHLFLKPFWLEIFALPLDFCYKYGRVIVCRNGHNVHFLLVDSVSFRCIPP